MTECSGSLIFNITYCLYYYDRQPFQMTGKGWYVP